MNIDDPIVYESGIDCPDCGEELEFIPKQSGPCHAGLFIAHTDEFYWCIECEKEVKVIDGIAQKEDME